MRRCCGVWYYLNNKQTKMKTSTFIEKQAAKIRNGEAAKGRCCSVFAETSCIYSYGYHYPLLFKIVTPSGKAILVVNRHGYSNTTSKHVGYAGMHADASVQLMHGTRYAADLYSSTSNYNNVINSLQNEKSFLERTMYEKKRKDTQVYQQLEWELARVNKSLAVLEYTK